MHLLPHPVVVERLKAKLNSSVNDVTWVFKKDGDPLAARGARIVLYHGICSRDHLRYNTLFLTVKMFEQQLRLFKKYFQMVSLEDYCQQNFNKDRFAVCLTFDDGYASCLKYVIPLLEKYEIPATFFITGIRDAGYDVLWNDVLSIAYRHGPREIVFQSEIYVKGRDRKYRSHSTGELLSDLLRDRGFNDKAEMINILRHYLEYADNDFWKQLSVEEIRKLSTNRWVTIGSHGYYHNDLAKIPEASVNEELSNSKKFLERITGKEIRAIAFPYGSYSDMVVKSAKDAGYTQLLGTDALLTGNSSTVDRLTVNPFIPARDQLRACIVGKYD